MNKNLIIGILVLIIAGGAWYIFAGMEKKDVDVEEQNEEQIADEPLPADSLAGVWQATDDPNAVRTIYENGGYMDTYEGSPEATTEGPWVTFTAENAPENFPFEAAEGVTYLELGGEESLFFSIAELTEEKLVLIYLNRGGTLEYTRVIQ